ncbi:MAG: hypothetical protein ACR2GC_07355, partial [Methyloceanibacter sp.]|uniref:hypothetical protein n=1 Tax=Methyloceanibacter sp. TaxID=1965321 RepID=UPI003D9B8107
RGDEDRVNLSAAGRRGAIPGGREKMSRIAGKCEEKPLIGWLIPLSKADMQVKQDYKGTALPLPHAALRTA